MTKLKQKKRINISPVYPLIPLKEKVVAGEFELGRRVGGLNMHKTSFSSGVGKDTFRADHQGIWLGDTKFADAPFRVNMEGDLGVSSIAFNRLFISSNFESLDGWATDLSGTGGITHIIGLAELSTWATSSSSAELFMSFGLATFDSKNFTFDAYLSLEADTTTYFGSGRMNSFPANRSGMGFKIVNNTLSAITSDNGTETLTTITGITVSAVNHYRAVWNYVDKVAEFYVNGELKATHDSTGNLPTGNRNPVTFKIVNDVAANRVLRLRSMSFTVDR